jgi:hypothetical protein
MVSEISVHALLLCAYGEAEHHGGEYTWSKTASPGSWEAEREEVMPSRSQPNDLTSSFKVTAQ